MENLENRGIDELIQAIKEEECIYENDSVENLRYFHYRDMVTDAIENNTSRKLVNSEEIDKDTLIVLIGNDANEKKMFWTKDRKLAVAYLVEGVLRVAFCRCLSITLKEGAERSLVNLLSKYELKNGGITDETRRMFFIIDHEYNLVSRSSNITRREVNNMIKLVNNTLMILQKRFKKKCYLELVSIENNKEIKNLIAA